MGWVGHEVRIEYLTSRGRHQEAADNARTKDPLAATAKQTHFYRQLLLTVADTSAASANKTQTHRLLLNRRRFTGR
jgi:hypothetical protein